MQHNHPWETSRRLTRLTCSNARNFRLGTFIPQSLVQPSHSIQSMKPPPNIDSPFMQAQPLRFSFSTILIMLLTVVGAGVGLLTYYALQVPAITSEFNAWLGRPNPVVDTAEGRSAHVKFLLVVYSAPLALGMLVYLLHYAMTILDSWTRSSSQADDEPFRMD